MSEQTITAVRVDLMDAQGMRDWYRHQYEEVLTQRNSLLEALQKIATADLSDGMVRYELKDIARAAIEKAAG